MRYLTSAVNYKINNTLTRVTGFCIVFYVIIIEIDVLNGGIGFLAFSVNVPPSKAL